MTTLTHGATTGPKPTKSVQSIDRAVRLLRAVATAAEVAPENSTAARLAESAGLNRATAWRILHTLEAHRMVCLDAATGHWSIGPMVADIARVASSHDLVARARPTLERLAARSGETAALAVVRPIGLTYVDEVAPASVVAATWRGKTVPLHATSTGKVLLAFSDPAPETGPLHRFTDSTITQRPTLAAELRETRRRCFACCRGEYDAAAWGVSAPVLGADRWVIAVLSVWGPAGRVTEADFDRLGAMVVEAAAGLSG